MIALRRARVPERGQVVVDAFARQTRPTARLCVTVAARVAQIGWVDLDECTNWNSKTPVNIG